MECRVNCVIILAMLSLFSNANVFTYGLFESFVNVALQKPARQSSTYIGKAEYNDRDGFNYSASLAVDGNNSTNFRNDSCSLTDANNTSSWWAVDLQGSYMLSKIRIFQRSDAFTDRNDGSRIWGLSDNSYIDLGCLNISSPVVTIDILSQHRFKQIRIDNAKTHGDAYLCLCEVQVFADFDECRDGHSFCNNNGNCYNTQGSFNCSCYRGFTGKKCETDVDECRHGDSFCNNNGKCHNTQGSFNCTCNGGYTGEKCETAIQCMNLMAPTHGKLIYESGIERRTNTFNSTVSMTCANGYQAFGNTRLRCGEFGSWNGSLGNCTDIDECRDGDSFCNNRGKCYNTDGSFICNCYGGFTGKQCETDVNECKVRTNVCSGRGRCSNTLGSFICQCHDGYTGQLCNTAIQCIDLVKPTHGNLRYANGIEGRRQTYNSTVLMTCATGYQSFGYTLLRCLESGLWNGSLGSCTALQCMNLVAPAHGYLRYENGIERRTNTFNSTVLLTCAHGYHASGETLLRCGESGTWNGSLGRCTAIQCIDLVKPTHGNLRYADGIEGRRQTYNSTVLMTCATGYQSFGYTLLRCLESGLWNGSLGSCTALQCMNLVAPAHGYLRYENGIERRTNTFNSTVLLTCAHGYHASGETLLRCGESGTWNGSLGRCTAIQCIDLVKPTHGNLRYADGIEGRRQTYNSTVLMTCATGYQSFGYTLLRCLESGLWNGSLGSCTALQCMNLVAPAHGYLRYKNGIERRTNTFNSTVLLTCVHGYHASGETLLRCGESGTWNGSLGRCTAIQCIDLVKPTHGNLRYADGIEGRRQTYNSTVLMTCATGYQSFGYTLLRCLESGLWNGSLGSCTALQCMNLVAPAHGYLRYENGIERRTNTFNSTVLLTCAHGYHASGETLLRCGESGTWNGSLGRCTVIHCTKHLDEPDHSELTYTGGIEGSKTYNTVVTARCKEGYNLTKISQILCNERGEWEGSSGICSVIVCESLLRPNNSILSIDGGIEGNWTYNTTATVSCDLGYTLTGNKTVRCTHSSQWNGSIGYCVEMESLDSDYHAAGSVGGVVVAVFLVVVGAVIGILVYRRIGRPLEQTARTSSEEFPRSSEQTTTHNVMYAKSIQMKEQVSKTSEVKGDNEYTNTGNSSREYYSYLPKKVTDKHAIQLEDLSSFFLGRKMDLKLYHEEYNELPQGLSTRHDTALLPENQKKNRYKNIYPYDDTRVQLEIWDPATETDYINACYVNGFKSFHAYIAAQGPTLEILNDFWRMLWQTKSLKIVMLTNLIEDGKHKCDKYWPDEGSIEFGAISVRLVQCESFSDFTVRTLELTKVQKEGNEKLEQRHVKQFHFTAWPDKRVPRYASSLVHFHRKVRKTKVPGSTDGPIVVHCSAGIGRTGTFLALDYLVEQAEELGYINVFKCLETFRKQRVGLVQTAEQYIFVHEALVEALTCTTSSLSTSEFLVSYNALLEADVTNIKRQIDFEFEKLAMYVDDATEDVFENGKRTDNRQKNRYSNILPDKNYCPCLNVYVKGRGSYINAVFLPAYKMTDIFIITQTPLENTKVDFWRMVYQFDVRSIVMMNTLSQMKDEERYWPEDEKVLKIPPFRITLESKSADGINCNYIFSLRYSEHLRKVQLSRAIYWTDDEPVPKSPSPMLKQIDLIQKRQQETGNKPIIVHCMNGAERSGLFCVVAALIERVMTEQDVAVEQIIKQMRSRRPQVIPSVVQFKFCYDAIKTYLEQYDSYANFARP